MINSIYGGNGMQGMMNAYLGQFFMNQFNILQYQRQMMQSIFQTQMYNNQLYGGGGGFGAVGGGAGGSQMQDIQTKMKLPEVQEQYKNLIPNQDGSFYLITKDNKTVKVDSIDDLQAKLDECIESGKADDAPKADNEDKAKDDAPKADDADKAKDDAPKADDADKAKDGEKAKDDKKADDVNKSGKSKKSEKKEKKKTEKKNEKRAATPAAGNKQVKQGNITVDVKNNPNTNIWSVTVKYTNTSGQEKTIKATGNSAEAASQNLKTKLDSQKDLSDDTRKKINDKFYHTTF